MNPLSDLYQLVDGYLEQVAHWHQREPSLPEPLPNPARIAETLHFHNFTLWHLGDRARDGNVADQVIAEIKRGIDRANQLRNDCIERLDDAVLSLAPASSPNAELHSETLGALSDRLSINALKIFHMKEQVDRKDASASHRESCSKKLEVLERQRKDLLFFWNRLAEGVLSGRLRFQVYRQMKMYNDPTLNPVLYKKSQTQS